MNELHISAVVLGLGLAISTSNAEDLSRYSSRAALLGRRSPEVSIAVLAGASGTERAVAAPSSAPHAVSVDSFNTKKALIGRRWSARGFPIAFDVKLSRRTYYEPK